LLFLLDILIGYVFPTFVAYHGYLITVPLGRIPLHGSAQGLDSLPEVIGMGMMGLGGLISIIGGILFLIVMLKSMWPDTKQAQ